MPAKILAILALLILVLYIVLPRRRASAPWPRRQLLWLAGAALLQLTLACLCLLLWLGSAGGSHQADWPLRAAAVLLTTGLACASAALYKRRRG